MTLSSFFVCSCMKFLRLLLLHTNWCSFIFHVYTFFCYYRRGLNDFFLKIKIFGFLGVEKDVGWCLIDFNLRTFKILIGPKKMFRKNVFFFQKKLSENLECFVVMRKNSSYYKTFYFFLVSYGYTQ